ncbi:MAG: hypothetical protein IT453_13370 [Planctomycetes bacterium]|nr:hypothetical protein [Planctomycetota bacterium]
MSPSNQAQVAGTPELREFLTLCLTHAETALESRREDEMANSLAAILASARQLSDASRAAHRRAFVSRMSSSTRSV